MLEGVVPWPVEAAELYRKLGYWRGETIGECFDRSIADNAARLAVVDGERRVTYATWARWSSGSHFISPSAASRRAGA